MVPVVFVKSDFLKMDQISVGSVIINVKAAQGLPQIVINANLHFSEAYHPIAVYAIQVTMKFRMILFAVNAISPVIHVMGKQAIIV